MSTLRRLGPRVATFDARRVKPAPKTGAKFYDSPEWRSLVKQIVATRGRRCQDCGKTHDDAGQPARIEAHHIREIADGGEVLDPQNVKLLCRSCHAAATYDARARRAGRPAGCN